MSCTKSAELIEMPFALWTRVGPRKYVLGGVHTGATWQTLLNVHVCRRCSLLSNYFDHLFAFTPRVLWSCWLHTRKTIHSM